MPKPLLDRLKDGVVLGDGGYLLALETRGYVQAGPFTPEVTIEHPNALRALHQEFIHAGAEVLIERWGLREENSRTLLSLEATKDAIRESITGWLASQAGPGDLAIFYFAGHGAQVFDLDGDEPDGLDETLAPTDIMLLSSERDIRDDELRVWLETIPAQVLVILDSCHSGTATRGTGPMRPRILDRPLPPEGGNEPDVVRQRYDPESMADGNTSIIEVAAAGHGWASHHTPARDQRCRDRYGLYGSGIPGGDRSRR